MEKEIRFTCPVASKCGGCQMGKLSYREQLDAKKAWVDELLRPFCRVEPIIGMEDPFHYRNKTHAVLAGDRRGNIISGVYRAGTHDVVPVEHCLIENEKADEIIGTIRSLMKSFRIQPYNEDTKQGFLRHILIRTGHVSGQILVVLVAASPVFPSKNNFVKALLKALAETVQEAGKEYITIYYGEDITQAQAQEAADLFAEICPDADVNLLFGGQPVYYYLISAE